MANASGVKLVQVPPNGPDLKWFNQLYQAVNDAYGFSSSTSLRPTNPIVGMNVFDTTLGKPIWCKQAAPTVVWVDATGAVV